MSGSPLGGAAAPRMRGRAPLLPRSRRCHGLRESPSRSRCRTPAQLTYRDTRARVYWSDGRRGDRRRAGGRHPAIRAYALSAPRGVVPSSDGSLTLGGGELVLDCGAAAASRRAGERRLGAAGLEAGSAPGGSTPAFGRTSRVSPCPAWALSRGAVGTVAEIGIPPDIELGLGSGIMGAVGGTTLRAAHSVQFEAALRRKHGATRAQPRRDAVGLPPARADPPLMESIRGDLEELWLRVPAGD